MPGDFDILATIARRLFTESGATAIDRAAAAWLSARRFEPIRHGPCEGGIPTARNRRPRSRSASMTVGGMPERSPFMFRVGLVLILTAMATLIGWRLLDRDVTAADVEGPLQGVTDAP